MRLSPPIFAGAILLAWTGHASRTAPTPVDHETIAQVPATKTAGPGTSLLPDPIHVNVGGDTFATATVIPGLPYQDTGNTCPFASDYESCVGCFTCPYSPTGARDVVYRFTPVSDTAISIDLCASVYDTKVYIVVGDIGNVVNCNDDHCGTGPLYQSLIVCQPVLAGYTYYIIVDGYSSADCGGYFLDVTECCCPTITCPPDAVIEGEPDCFDGYDDTYNGGCNSDPPVFTDLPCADWGDTTTVCGTYGGFLHGGVAYRDTDWYQIVLAEPSTITWCVQGQYVTLCGIIDGRTGCPVNAFFASASGGPIMPVCVTAELPAGTWWLWVGTAGFGPSAGPCGGEYVARLTGHFCGPTAMVPATWGRTKGMYR